MSTIFKKIIDREIPASIVYEDETVLAFLDIYPIKKGHVLIVPKKEYINIFDIDPVVFAHMATIAQRIARVLMLVVKARGVNIHMNNGEEAGQDIFHAHLHVIPRFTRGEAFTAPVHESYAAGEDKNLADEIRKMLCA